MKEKSAERLDGELSTLNVRLSIGERIIGLIQIKRNKAMQLKSPIIIRFKAMPDVPVVAVEDDVFSDPCEACRLNLSRACVNQAASKASCFDGDHLYLSVKNYKAMKDE